MADLRGRSFRQMCIPKSLVQKSQQRHFPSFPSMLALGWRVSDGFTVAGYSMFRWYDVGRFPAVSFRWHRLSRGHENLHFAGKPRPSSLPGTERFLQNPVALSQPTSQGSCHCSFPKHSDVGGWNQHSVLSVLTSLGHTGVIPIRTIVFAFSS